MSLREKLRGPGDDSAERRRRALYKEYGVMENPFPPAGQATGHPRMEVSADDAIVKAVQSFDRDRTSQVLLVEGTQGVGKTNLLSYLQSEFEDLYQDSDGYYIIRYYPDPEASFDGILRRILQELGSEHLKELGVALAGLDERNRDNIIERARNYEVRCVLQRLASCTDPGERSEVAEAALEWLVGLRVLRRHRDLLNIQLRLDTVESRTQALRDIVETSAAVGHLHGIFLLLDELEKQDYSLSKTIVLRYLSAVRALIDALPKNLFMLVAITTEAKRRYFEMLPAFAGRLQNSVKLRPLESFEEAQALYTFYLARAKEKATKERAKSESKDWGKPGATPIADRAWLARRYEELEEESSERGIEGVTQRDFLNMLHLKAEEEFQRTPA